jgi:hypothetical protein
MTANRYYFLDRWYIPHPIEVVWPHILDAEHYPAWWGEVYTAIKPLNDLPPGQIGARADVYARGRLPYQIHFVSELTEIEAPYRLGLKAQGDLTGTGLWTLQPQEGGTAVAFEWIVQADKPIIRFFSPVIKPLFAWNHRWCMLRGEAALKRLLAQQTKVAESSQPGGQQPRSA